MKFACYTLGCKVNQYETQAMEQLLMQSGHTLGSFDEICDGYIINTCTVTAVSDKKSRNAIRRVRKLNPNAVVGVCGCYAQSSPDEIRKLDVDVLIGTDGREAFVRHMIDAAQTRQKWDCVDDAGGSRTFEILPAGGLAARTRALLKVEDGCNNFCTYCIIPYARGRVRSMPLDVAVEQARGLAAEGYREIVINGIEISSWGWEWKNGSCLRQLLAALCEAVPGVRIRLGSLEPRTIDEAFCKTLSGYANLCPQFHLSLQSGSDTVLKRMHRKYDTARYLESVRLLRKYFPGCAVTTDLIVGFPGETEEEFAESLEFLKTCGLSMFHIFPYSRRKGTPAADMPDQIPNAVKERRAAEAASAAAELEAAYHASMLGTTQQVLFEQEENGLYAGHAMNYVKVYVQAAQLHNELRAVRVTDLCRDGVFGELELALLRPRLAESQKPKPIVQKHCQQRNEQPRAEILRADLPANIVRQTAVVPDGIRAVEQGTEHQLRTRYDAGAEKRLRTQRQPRRPFVEHTDERRAQAAVQKHTPMGAAAPEKLYADIDRPARKHDQAEISKRHFITLALVWSKYTEKFLKK